MIFPSTLEFLSDLKENNSREWMNEKLDFYKMAKNDILLLTENLLNRISYFDETISSQTNPKKCLTRLNRDLRFSKNKTPYKTGYFIVINKNGKNSRSAFYYLYIEPGNSFFGAGLWNPLPDDLKKIRKEIYYLFEEWNYLVNQEAFTSSFPSGIQSESTLKNVPKEFTNDHPAAHFLKMKGYCTKEKLGDEELDSVNLVEQIMGHFKNAKPLVNFLNNALKEE